VVATLGKMPTTEKETLKQEKRESSRLNSCEAYKSRKWATRMTCLLVATLYFALAGSPYEAGRHADASAVSSMILPQESAYRGSQ
jgi:hypothetical protein